MEGRLIAKPKIFDPIQLEEVLKQKRYQLILEKACVQFEPDDPEFIRVTYRTYEFINENNEFEVLRSTRFFGPMSFYLTWYNKLENLLSYFLDTNSTQDCLRLVKLHKILHANVEEKSLNYDSLTYDEQIEIIKQFIRENLKDSAKAELAIMNLIERNKEQQTVSVSN